MSTLPIAELKNVTKVIRGKAIVDRLSFAVYPGEVFGLLGPNGAGKTTTIRMLVGLMRMSAGDVLIQKKSIRTDYPQAIVHVAPL